MKFKVGDIVKRIGPEYDGEGLAPDDYGLGFDLEVTKVCSEGYYELKDIKTGKNKYSAWEMHLEESHLNANSANEGS